MALESLQTKAHTPIMAEKHPKRPRDINQWAKRMTDIVSGNIEDGVPVRPSNASSPQSLGGKARAVALKSKRRTEIAKKAAKTRWKARQVKSDA
jgi:hypothetical protein